MSWLGIRRHQIQRLRSVVRTPADPVRQAVLHALSFQDPAMTVRIVRLFSGVVPYCFRQARNV
jgi:hypothetical protein